MALITRTYSDLDLDFGKHPVTGDILKKKDVLAVATSLKNLFNTSNYERLFQPDIGCDLKRMLFEPIDVTSTVLMQDVIKQTIINFEPRVKLQDVSVEAFSEKNGYKVFVTFYYGNTPEPITIRLFLERIR